MKISVKNILFLLHGIWFSYLFSQQQDGYYKLLQRVINNDISVFYDDYLAAKTSYWLAYYDFPAFTIDAVARDHDYLYLTVVPKEMNVSDYPLILKTGLRDSIIYDIFKKISADSFETHWQTTVLEFSGHFLWEYDNPQPSFLMDFLYPDYVEMEYNGLNNKSDIIALLRNHRERNLHIRSINWQRQQEWLSIILDITDLPAKISFKIHYKKYVTAGFFRDSNLNDRLYQLQDSLLNWAAEENGLFDEPVLFKTDESKTALARFMDLYFNYQTIKRHRQNNSFAEFDSYPPTIYGNRPLKGRYSVMAVMQNKQTCSVRLQWLSDMNYVNRILSQFFSENEIIKIDKAEKEKIKRILDREIGQYNSLGQPVADLEGFFPVDKCNWNVNLSAFKDFSLKGNTYGGYASLLRKLADKLNTYVFIRKLSYQGGLLEMKFILILSSNKGFWQHLAMVNSTYSPGDRYSSKNRIDLQLYPFIRSDNVNDLFATEQNSQLPKTIILLK